MYLLFFVTQKYKYNKQIETTNLKKRIIISYNISFSSNIIVTSLLFVHLLVLSAWLTI